MYEGEVLEVIPLAAGIVFSHCKGKDDKNMAVGYKMVNFETGVMTDIANNIYLLSKFGNNFPVAKSTAYEYVSANSIVLPSGRIFVCSKDATAKLIDGDGTVVWQGTLSYKGTAPSGMALSKDALWATYKKQNAILRYNLNTMREDLRIGGGESPFCKPSGIFIDGGYAYISCPADKKIIKIDLENYDMETYIRFKEPVYNYVKVKDYEFVLLKSGLYIV